MKIHTLIKRGEAHQDFCEDFLISLPLNDKFYVAAVADGCSSGIDSHFAAALWCKIFRKIVLEYNFYDEQTIEKQAINILNLTIEAFKCATIDLALQPDEQLATLITLFYDIEKKIAFCVALGDGAVCFNDHIYTIDQDNRADYPAYHLNDSPTQLATYLQKQTFIIENPTHLAIATDGVFAFQATETHEENKNFSPTDYLLRDDKLANTANMLKRKINILATQYHFQPYDDVSIVRLFLPST